MALKLEPEKDDAGFFRERLERNQAVGVILSLTGAFTLL
jgi:hypothetical protein